MSILKIISLISIILMCCTIVAVATPWTGYTNNCAGYEIEAYDHTLTEVKGSWIVPTVSPAGIDHQECADFWVGMQGTVLAQTGTTCLRNYDGSVEYSAWYEFYPEPPVTVDSMTIHPGDKISADSYYDGYEYLLSISDITTGQHFSVYSPRMANDAYLAEYFVEAPNYIEPFINFGNWKFGPAYNTGVTTLAKIDGQSKSIGEWDAAGMSVGKLDIMNDNNRHILTQTSGLSADGKSFSVAWKRAS